MPSLDKRALIALAQQKLAAAPRTPMPRPAPIIGAHRAPPATSATPADPADTIEAICTAVVDGIDRWRAQAHFVDVVITGPSASGGSLRGPDLAPLIKTGLATSGPGSPAVKYGGAVADALGSAWSRWANTVRVPGLPWYPPFAWVAAPTAPPTPNVPTPLATCASDPTAFKPATLKRDMAARLRPSEPAADRLFTAFCEAFEVVLPTWMAGQPVTNVLGQGPVPAFAPPGSPGGPVVGGTIVPAPPHLGS